MLKLNPGTIYKGEKIECDVRGKMEVTRTNGPWPLGRKEGVGRGRPAFIVFGELRAALDTHTTKEIAAVLNVGEITVDGWKQALGIKPNIDKTYEDWGGEIGQTVVCKIKGECRVTGLVEGKIRWPLGRIEGQRGRPSLMVFGALEEALRNDPIENIVSVWGANRVTVEKYAQLLKVATPREIAKERVKEGVMALREAAMAVTNAESKAALTDCAAELGATINKPVQTQRAALASALETLDILKMTQEGADSSGDEEILNEEIVEDDVDDEEILNEEIVEDDVDDAQYRDDD